MKIRFTPAIIIFLSLLPQIFFSQKEEIQFTHFSMKDGLSMNPVMSIVQDKRGFMWFGTQDGLNKYDGYNVTVFKSSDVDSCSISDNFITSQCVDDSGRLWVGTLNGFNLYDKGKFIQFRKNKSDFLNEKIYSLYKDTDGFIWVGTEQGLALFDPYKLKFLNVASRYPGLSALVQRTVLCIFRTSNNQLWFGTTAGLFQFNVSTGAIRNFYVNQDEDGALSNNIVLCMYEDAKRNLWVGTLNGLNRYDALTNTFIHKYFKEESDVLTSTRKNNAVAGANIYSIVNNYGGNTIRCILEDADGWLWIGTDMELIIYNPQNGNFINYKKDLINPNGINDHFIRSIFADRSANLWIGTLGNGINKVSLKPKKFKHYQKKLNNPQSLSENYVRAICEDDNGKIWVGTLVGGLNCFDTKTETFSSLRKTNTVPSNSIGDNNVWSETYDKIQKGLWLGTNNGLDFFDVQKNIFYHYQHGEEDENSISDNTVRSVYIDSKGRLWCGTENGLNLFDRESKKFTSWNTQNSSISNNTIWKIEEDEWGNLWLATNDGLNRFNPGSKAFTVFKKVAGDTTSLSHDGVRTLLYDGNNILWVGTQNGLNRMDISKGKFVHYYEKDGLPNPFIYSIIKDKKGHYWISSNKGLSEFDGKTFRNYDVNDGLQDYEFNTNAGFISSSGEIFFGGPSGLNRFNPSALATNTFVPPVVFTSLKVMDKPFTSAGDLGDLKEITLHYDENILYFSFAALDFTNPSRNRFMYKMEGFNKEWISAGTARDITYTNLDPGEYVLKVKGSNADGIWNDVPAQIKITILPPFWKTFWFYSLCAFTAVAGTLFYIRRRTRGLIKSKQELEVKVAERTAEVESQRNELAEKNKDITDSINYAQRIQKSIVPGEEVFIRNFADAFVFYKPRDIVSGDFYWYKEVHRSTGDKEPLKIFAAIDCTGHGVPGAFMSLIANDLLNQTLKNKDVNSPGDVLKFLNQKLPQTLNKADSEKIRDGMDMAVCAYDEAKKILYFAGANRPLWLTDKDGDFREYDPTKASVGGYTEEEQEFYTHKIQLEKGDAVYLFTDGFTDQFGGPKSKKIGSRKFKELIAQSAHIGKQQQKNFLVDYLDKWKGEEHSQIDDICVIGIKF